MSSEAPAMHAVSPVELSWTGFRGFRRRTRFTLPRLTLLIGRNNVGKSSAYAPLLMMKQTLDANSPETALLSRGPLVDVGRFRDYVSDHQVDSAVTFSITLPGEDNLARIAGAESTFRSTDGQGAFLARQRLLNYVDEPIIIRTRKHPKEQFMFKSTYLPSQSHSGRPPKELGELRRAIRNEQPDGFMFEGVGGVIIPRILRDDEDRWARAREWYNAGFGLWDRQQDFKSQMTHFLRSIAYVGPLRSLPQRTYRLGAEAPLGVGSTGEFAPEIFVRGAAEEPSDRVREWLRKMGYGELRHAELNEEYFEMRVRRASGLEVNIADSGVGLSQVFPLLTQASLAPAGTMVIAQQPEIHLNPAQQSLVADFLMERAREGVRMVIETHSEHVLLRLRRRIAEGMLRAEDVAIYFLDNFEDSTRVRRLSLGDSAELDRNEWPDGFFEEQLDDSFALATAQARRARSV